MTGAVGMTGKGAALAAWVPVAAPPPPPPPQAASAVADNKLKPTGAIERWVPADEGKGEGEGASAAVAALPAPTSSTSSLIR